MSSVTSYSVKGFNQIHSDPTVTLRLGLLSIASIALITGSVPSVLGQSDSASVIATQSTAKAEICIPDTESAKGSLSLAISKAKPSSDDSGATENSYTLRATSESSRKAMDLAEPEESNSAAPHQDPICKKANETQDPAQSEDSQQPGGQAAPLATAPTASTVTYSNGELSVNAADIPLQELIEDIRTRTGIAVEFPRESVEDRVYDHFGPAPLRDALAKLLYGSGFDYVIQASPLNPETVTRLILSKQFHFASAEQPARPVRPRTTPTDEVVTPEPTVSYNDIAAEHPRIANLQQIGIPENFNLQQAAAAAGKTPGQILDELQKRQQELLDAQAPPQ